jgi:hypothetical protein
MSWYKTALSRVGGWGTSAKTWAGSKNLSMPGASMLKGSASAAGIGAVAGAGWGAVSDDTSMLGGAAMGAALGAGVPAGLKYGGMGVKKAGMAGIARSWTGKAGGISSNQAHSLISGGNKISGVGANFNSFLANSTRKGANWASSKGFGGAKTAAWNGVKFAGGGAAAGALGWLGSDFLRDGAGINSVKPNNLMSSMMQGAAWGVGGGVGLKALGFGATKMHAASSSKFLGSKNMKLFQGGMGKTAALTQSVAESNITKGALAIAAVSSGVKMTRPVNG